MVCLGLKWRGSSFRARQSSETVHDETMPWRADARSSARVVDQGRPPADSTVVAGRHPLSHDLRT